MTDATPGCVRRNAELFAAEAAARRLPAEAGCEQPGRFTGQRPSREFTRAPTMARILSLYRQMLHPSQPLTARRAPQRIAPADEWVDSAQR